MKTEISTLAPLEDRILILQDTPDEITEGGIFLPLSAQTQETIGTVVATGPGEFYDLYDFGGVSEHSILRFKPMVVKPGDRVLYTRYGGTDVTVAGTTYQVMRHREIIAILGVADESEFAEAIPIKQKA